MEGLFLVTYGILAERCILHGMHKLKRWWKQVPATIRRPVVFLVGAVFIFAAALTGWLPGPGGIPLFLVGIAILATEFERAKQFRDWILRYIELFGKWLRAHKVLGTVLLLLAAGAAVSISVLLYKTFK